MGKERHKVVPASYLVLIKNEKILLQRRFNTGFQDGKYSLPAGHVEKGETFTLCVAREVREEVGVNLKAENLKVIHIMHRDSRADFPQGVAEDINERVDVFFACEIWEGEPKIMETDKCDDLSWFDLNKLPENIIPYIKYALECINNKIFYSEFGWNKN